MKKSLKLKILSGFLLLVALLFVAGTESIIEFNKLSNSFTELIEDNYKTIEASRTMLEALEREDSGILLIMLGKTAKGQSIILSADSSFMAAFRTAKNNITESGEDIRIVRIEESYHTFKQKWQERFFLKSSAYDDIEFYSNDVHRTFLEVKHAVNELMSLNQNSMHSEAVILKDKSHRAIMPGIVAIVGALVFSLLLSFFISKYYISPINQIIQAIKTFHPRDKVLRTTIKSEDDLKQLEVEVNNLIDRLNKNNYPQK
ncbi:MAG TPA: hypothetical protein PL017_05675 [Tenuifilaceae bacterium]|nr:hypothetical protein [Tenuifilaceae bacterium]HPE18659.1 hypothetical protein [Tenuifilaceae bacterium]HPJ45568.1 hypothetical protein [Tenuifilaceae bacterium]HPQ33674.1 hypothetical protein [Tenuifilaceae bacterium]HRX68009.1 hypothetical protein [Tenuifilaceae bacterium]